MKSLIYALLICSQFIFQTTLAQNCKKLDEWTQSVELEFPDVDFKQLRSGSNTYNRIKYNLLSDKYFKPVFGNSFEKLKKGKRSVIHSKISKCGNSSSPLNRGRVDLMFTKDFESVKRLTFYMGTVFITDRWYGEAVRIVQEIRLLRNDYNHAIEKIKRKEVSFSELNDSKNLLKTKYSILLPSELDYFAELIQQSETEIANSTLLDKSKALSVLNNSLISLHTLRTFKSNNQLLVSKADRETIKSVDRSIERKTDEILGSLIPMEKNKVKNISLDETGVAKIDELYRNTYKDYGAFLQHALLTELIGEIEQKKTQIISSISNDIYVKVKNAQTEEELKNIEGLYLSNVSGENSNMKEIHNAISERNREFIAKERQRVEAERNRKQEINRIATEQQRIKNRRVQAVKNKRRELNLKYGTYFPTLDDLFEVLSLVPLIKNPVRVEDKRRFIAKVQTFGFELANDNGNLYADINTFKNNRNYELKTLKFNANNNRGLAIAAKCIFPNAPRDIIELYAMELNSEYRERTNPYFNKKEGNVSLLKESSQYIKSGGTIYYYEIDDGTLEVSALGNFDASGVVSTERLNHNTLKVNSYSNITDIRLNEGDVITFSAWGSVTLGFMAGSASPAGVNGFELYSISSRHKHGSLIGRIDKGNWFYIGNARTIVAPASGRLELKINDSDRSNNDGFFYVAYSIETQKKRN
jgi:hypothetical protein